MHCFHTTALRRLWVFVIAFSELGRFFISTSSCTWPVPPDPTEGVQRVLIVANPQIPAVGNSYSGRNALIQFIVGLNLRKAWMAAKRKRPDALIFLGDMVHNWRADISQTEYQASLNRFHGIFNVPSAVPTYHVAGDYGVGPGHMPTDTPDLRHAQLRYKTSFGPLNQHVQLANHSLVLVDAVGLAAARREHPDSVPHELEELRFMHSQFTRDRRELPVVLFTHMPLYRPDGSDCGPLREKGRTFGHKNMSSPDTSRLLLETFQPSLIFSGDDHDYCAYTHPAPSHASEITVKSISMATGGRRAGFHLLSLAPAAPPAHRPCTLPDPHAVYLRVYLPLLVLTIAIAGYMGATGQGTVIVAAHGHAWVEMRPLEEGGYAEAKEDDGATDSVILWRSRVPGGMRRVLRDLGSIAWPPAALYVCIVVFFFW
ncbi:hypothetical protein FA95DRAFT_1554746 [Auriscalpium vulgare]|uniref:Uncharacterized protein n=1 Tax=Auriscalpium vulgare TaxID=40419 RepID=A0ACB8S4X3_9AGAM|nr:hypothetical protein FA95DRAFT_1554746 [Auriscalpium vulgare]